MNYRSFRANFERCRQHHHEQTRNFIAPPFAHRGRRRCASEPPLGGTAKGNPRKRGRAAARRRPARPSGGGRERGGGCRRTAGEFHDRSRSTAARENGAFDDGGGRRRGEGGDAGKTSDRPRRRARGGLEAGVEGGKGFPEGGWTRDPRVFPGIRGWEGAFLDRHGNRCNRRDMCVNCDVKSIIVNQIARGLEIIGTYTLSISKR